MTNEPRRELQGAHTEARARVVVVAGGREPEVVLVVEVELVEVFNPVLEANLLNGERVAHVIPFVESLDDDRMLQQIDHGARTVRADQLALPNLPVGLAFGLPRLVRAPESGHQRPCFRTPGCDSQTCTAGSTSRMDVGAQNFSSP